MNALITSGTSNIEGIDNALEFYSLALETVSATNFYYDGNVTI